MFTILCITLFSRAHLFLFISIAIHLHVQTFFVLLFFGNVNTIRYLSHLLYFVFNHLSILKSDFGRILAAKLVSFWDADLINDLSLPVKLRGQRMSYQDILPILIKYSSWLQVARRRTIMWHERWEIGADVAAKDASPATTAIAVIIRWRIWGGTWRMNAANSRCISAPTVRTGRLTSPIFRCTWWSTPDRASYLARSSSSNIRIHERSLNVLPAK